MAPDDLGEMRPLYRERIVPVLPAPVVHRFHRPREAALGCDLAYHCIASP